MIASNAEMTFVPSPIIKANPPTNSIIATTYARNPGNPILENQPT